MLPSTAKGLDLRSGGCGPPTLRQIWPAAERAPKCFRTSKPIALIISTRPPEQNFLFWAKDVHISLPTTRSLGSKKLSSKQRLSRVGRLSRQGPTKGRDFSPRPKERTHSKHRPAEPAASAGIHPSHQILNLGYQWSSVRAKVKGAGKKGGQRLTPAPRISSAQGFAALFAGRDVPPSECVIPELQSPPNSEVPGPSTSFPPLCAARDSQPRPGPEELTENPQTPNLLRPNLLPTKPKCKAKSK